MKNNNEKKLVLNKETVAHLRNKDMGNVLAGKGDQKGCWENLWTMYHCDVFGTTTPPRIITK
ncbi:MAG: hypothetical protein GY765_18515 [bacterium]|nr:hypothetical protein [bacterium]